MSEVYNPDADIKAEIERLELEAREIRRKRDQATGEQDRDVLQRQLVELEERINRLQARLP